MTANPASSPRRWRRLVGVLLVGLGLLAASLAGAFAWGVQTFRRHWFPYDLLVELKNGEMPEAPDVRGRWRMADGTQPWDWHDDEAFTMAQLEALGYAEGTVAATANSGVVHRDPRAYESLALVTSGHAPEVSLMTLDGEVVHRWGLPQEQVFPQQVAEGGKASAFYRRARLLPDGGVVTMFVDYGVFRLDRDNQVVWTWQGGPHHDLQVVGDELWVLTRAPAMREELDPTEPIVDDGVVVLDLATGAEKRSFRLFDAIADSDFASLVHDFRRRKDDVFHTNTLQVLDGRHAVANPAFAAGNLLLSMRHVDLVLVVDPVAEKVVWAMSGLWHRQHEPTLTPEGRLLVFDNRGIWPRSRVLEVDPATQRITWSHDGGDVPIISATCGTAARLPNGHTMIVASDTGRAVEVTPDHEVVWEFFSPHRAGEADELVATLFQVERLRREELGVFADHLPAPEERPEGP
ncbi:MAG: hypothetical protein EP330_11235 [Deltaproteobacteria bacterium]|nr:MAG: hypothetical protein EP330_11235 [Deltaproteobacteria bacterium]